MNAEIIVIGDELLIGQVIDTNSGMIERMLNKAGIVVDRTTAIHDNAADIRAAITEALSRTDLVFMTGGLGPTKDDITKQTLCDYFMTKLVYNEQVEKHVRELYADRPQVLNRLTETQWLVPEAALILENRIGSAPLMVFNKDGKWLYSMPGVPAEATVAMQEQFMPHIIKHFVTGEVIHKTVIVDGIPESSLALLIEDWENHLPKDMHLAYLPKSRQIRLRLTGITNENGSDLNERMEQQISTLCQLLGDYLLCIGDKPIEVLVGEQLSKKGKTISTAESCTGGKVAALLSKHSGSSDFFYGSVVSYDNSVKQNVLGVSQEVLSSVGAVSEQCVRAMAEGARRLLKTDYAVATSGIAGPTGGTTEKPVGTVWMAIATETETIAWCEHLRGDRERITDDAAVRVLVRLYRSLVLSVEWLVVSG